MTHEINQVREILQPGDIVFINIKNYLYKQVAKTSLSWTSHVGIVCEKDGEFVVAESALPRVTYCSLEKFMKRSDQGMFAARRLKGGVNKYQLEAMSKSMSSKMGLLYHLGFNYDSKRQYCSKFVYDVYKDSTGLEVGELETFGDVLKKNPDTSVWFWRLWFFGRLPLKRRAVTPASQYESKLLETVYQNF
jgi:hypothetical protein